LAFVSGTRETVTVVPADPAPTTWEAYARSLGVALQRARIERGLSQEVLAHLAGLTRTHYQQIERGWWRQGAPSNPSLRVVVRLAQALDVDVADVLPPIHAISWNRPD
jgi:transcriptional regulator with XRE-family HTH domain